MNWYKNIKLAQIWNVKSNGSFSSEIYSLYELEYKYSMVKTQPFDGLPQRRENILNNLQRELRIVINHIITPIKHVFKDWLERHDFVVDRNGQLFPRWWDEWRDEGIVEVRANIESIYNHLFAQNIEDAIAAISLAKNAMHVNGSMLGDIEEQVREDGLEEVFEAASNMDTTKWDQQLAAIGVRMDNINPIVEMEEVKKEPDLVNV